MNNEIDYKNLIEKYPWLIKEKQLAILSPDIDGFLCGLLLSNYLKWKIVGFYDGKVLVVNNNFSIEDCVFVDIEILRPNICSIGHHMIVHNINNLPPNFNFIINNCLNPNIIRGFDNAHCFSQKYPLGSIHFLLFIFDNFNPNLIKINKEGLGIIFFADGIWKILFKYTDNFLDWFKFLDVRKQSDWWIKLKNLSIIDLIEEIDNLIHHLQNIHPYGKKWFGHIDISDFENEKPLLIKLLELLGNLTGWNFILESWDLEYTKKYKFTKKIFSGRINNDTFLNIWNKNPLSLAITNRSTIQYTIEYPDILA